MGHSILQDLQKLQKLRDEVVPSSDWKKQSKAQLMRQIENTVGDVSPSSSLNWWERLNQRAQIFISPQVFKVVRPALASLLVVAVTFAGWSVGVRASSDSLPGERLWRLKLAFEQTELAVTTGAKEKAELQVKFAGRRAKEINEVVSKQQPVRAKKSVEDALHQLKASMESANIALDEIKDHTSESVAVARLIDMTSVEILDQLGETVKKVQEQKALDGNDGDITVLLAEVDEIADVVEESSVKSIGWLVEKSMDESSTVDKAVLKLKVAQKLENLVVKLDQIGTIVEQVVSSTTDQVIILPTPETAITPITTAFETTTTPTATASETTTTIKVPTSSTIDVEEIKSQLKETQVRVTALIDQTKSSLEQDALLDAVQGVEKLNVIKDELEDMVRKIQEANTQPASESELKQEPKLEVEGEKIEITSSTTSTVSEDTSSTTETSTTGTVN